NCCGATSKDGLTESRPPESPDSETRRPAGKSAASVSPAPPGLLRSRREWLRRGRAADQRDELAAFHCAIPPVRSTERIAHLSYGGRLLRCGSQVESDAQGWAIVRKVIE